jgi:hypothetical protein
MDLTLPQIKTLLHALEVAVQNYEELRHVEQRLAETISRYASGPKRLLDPHEAAVENCDNAILEFKNLAAGLKTRYRIELEKAAAAL